MPTKQTNSRLLWQCIIWVQFEYVGIPSEEQLKRTQRPYRNGDGKHISFLIKEINLAYRDKKLKQGKQAKFDECKEVVLTNHEISTRFGEPTRNFYASVIGTYFSWNYHGIPKEIEEQLTVLVPFASYLLQK